MYNLLVITLCKLGLHLVEWSYAYNKHGVSVIDKSQCNDLEDAFACEVYDNIQKIKYSGSDLQSRPQVRDIHTLYD